MLPPFVPHKSRTRRQAAVKAIERTKDIFREDGDVQPVEGGSKSNASMQEEQAEPDDDDFRAGEAKGSVSTVEDVKILKLQDLSQLPPAQQFEVPSEGNETSTSAQAGNGLRSPEEAVVFYDHNFHDNVEHDWFLSMVANPLQGEMDVGMIDGFLRYVLAMHTRSVLYVSLNYSAYVDNNGLAKVVGSGLENFVVVGDRSTFDLAIIPVRIATGHYVLAIYEVRTGCVRYFDSLPRPVDPRHHIDSIRHMTAYLHDTYRSDAPPPRFVIEDPAGYNHQADGISCGFFISLYVELYLQRCDADTLLVDDAFLPNYRRRVVRILADLFNGNFPEYGQLPSSIHSRAQRNIIARGKSHTEDDGTNFNVNSHQEDPSSSSLEE
ncbi:hypothetical protein AAVH_33109 [Aphelenchoides avenae]|nr:hypothetical protein AAVH_33109 [Aphelenchus avenae]